MVEAAALLWSLIALDLKESTSVRLFLGCVATKTLNLNRENSLSLSKELLTCLSKSLRYRNLLMRNEYLQSEETMNQHDWRRKEPYVLKTGKKYDYHWLHCVHEAFGHEFFKCCPELSQNVWTSPSFYEDEDYYVFDKEPNPTQIALVESVQFEYSDPSVDIEKLDSSWQALQRSGAKALCYYYLLIFKGEGFVERFLASQWVQALPGRHIKENKSFLRGWLVMETAGESCAQNGCPHSRIKYGANCGRHHFEMLMKEPFPDHDLTD